MSNVQLKDNLNQAVYPITTSENVKFSDGSNLNDKLQNLDTEVSWDKVTGKPTEFQPKTHTHLATQITEDATHRFVTDTEKTTWNGKADKNHTHSNYDPKSILTNNLSESPYLAYSCEYLENVKFPSFASSSHYHNNYASVSGSSSQDFNCATLNSSGDVKCKGNRVWVGSSYARIDCTGTTTNRLMADYSPDYAVIMRGSSGNCDIVMNNNTVHQFRENGTKYGGSINLNGTTYGMSPLDSPQSLIEDVLFDIDVVEEGTYVKLDNIFKQTISTYAVFASNGKVNIDSKDYNGFTVSGFTGKVDFRVIGKRFGEESSYFPIMANLDATTTEEYEQIKKERGIK